MVHNWVRIPILIFLGTVVAGLGSDNLIKVMEVFMIGGGLPQN